MISAAAGKAEIVAERSIVKDLEHRFGRCGCQRSDAKSNEPNRNGPEQSVRRPAGRRVDRRSKSYRDRPNHVKDNSYRPGHLPRLSWLRDIVKADGSRGQRGPQALRCRAMGEDIRPKAIR
jgi:hypothetical protein